MAKGLPKQPISCLRCDTKVIPKRSTKRFCTDHCRKMTYQDRTRAAQRKHADHEQQSSPDHF